MTDDFDFEHSWAETCRLADDKVRARAEHQNTKGNGQPEPPPVNGPEDGLCDDQAGRDDRGANGRERQEAPRIIFATPYQWCDPAAIPRRQWLYGRHLIRGFVSSKVAPGGTGKSKLNTIEAIEMTTGKPLLLNEQKHHKPLRVWLWNLEDPADEIARNIQATCLHYGVTEADLAGRLFVSSGREQACVVAQTRNGCAVIFRPLVDSIIAEIQERAIDVLMIDPFVSSHRVAENDNSGIDAVVKEWGRVAEGGNCAVDLTHHTRKLAGAEATVESSRGAKALVDACRSVRVLNRMTAQEGEKAGVDNHRLYFQALADKVNLAPPPDKADWYRLISVDLGNGPPGFSDHVGVVVRWQWPDAFEGVAVRDLYAVQKRLAEGEWRESSASPEWAGKAVAEVLDLDLSAAPVLARVKSLLKAWIESGALKPVVRPDAHRKERKYVEVGQWAMP